MQASRVLFIAQEIHPYVPVSTITPLGRELPLGLLAGGREVRAFMPKWGNINERRNQLHEVIRLSGLNVQVNGVDHSLLIKVASMPGSRMQIYFIDNDDFFGRRLHECDAHGKEYADNVERAAFYARSVLETIKKLRWVPKVIHCQGWISALVPLYLKKSYCDDADLHGCHVVYTPHPNSLTLPSGGNLDGILKFRGVTPDCYAEFGDSITPTQLDQLGIKFADGVHFFTPQPDATLPDYAASLGKPVLNLDKVDAPAFIQFYDQILS